MHMTKEYEIKIGKLMEELRIKHYRDKFNHFFKYIHDLPLKPKNDFISLLYKK